MVATSGAGRLTTWLVPIATAFVLLGPSVLPFLTPAWVDFEQDRAGAPALAQECADPVHAFTNSILRDLVVGGNFDAELDARASTAQPCFATSLGPLVLTEAERGHMGDVRGVFQGFGVLILASLLILGATWRRARERDSRATWWTAVRRGASGLAVLIAVLGAISLVAFDAAFEVFHRLFFAAGTYSFDPATSRLVQIFPDQFWSETTIAVAMVSMSLALATAWFAGRRAALTVRSPHRAASMPAGEVVR
jgi:integral membrane protein (TIGR01906 family)